LSDKVAANVDMAFWKTGPSFDYYEKVQIHSKCLKITTGAKHHDGGRLDVEVDEDGTGFRSVASGLWERGSVVMSACFSSLAIVRVQNPSTDGWAGSVLFSEGGGEFRALQCAVKDKSPGCGDPPQWVTTLNHDGSTNKIGVDGNNVDGTWGLTAYCFDGRACELWDSRSH